MLFAFVQFFAWVISNFIGKTFLNIEFKGRENLAQLNKGGVVFIANHQSGFDPFLISAGLDRSHYRQIKCFRYLTHYKHITRRWYGPLIWLSGAYPVYPSHGDYEKSLKHTIEILQDNQNVLFFPTGTRGKYFDARQARPGIGWLVKKINPIIVPVFIKNVYKISLKDLILRTRKTSVIYGKPFRGKNIIDDEKSGKEIAISLMEIVGKLVRFPPRQSMKSFAIIQNREESLKTDAASYLLSVLPKEIQKKLKKYYLFNDADSKEDLLNYFMANSKMFRLIKAFPGSAEAFEQLYLEEKPQTDIDRYFILCKSGRQIYQRLLALDKNLPLWIKKMYDGQKLTIDNIFSGPGRDMIRVLEQNPEIKKYVQVRNIDIDERAIRIGKILVAEKKLEDNFSFECKPFHRARPRQANLVILIGVLCPLELHTSERILVKMRDYVRPGGYIIYSTAQDSLLNDDPLTDALMRLSQWPMSYKTDQEAWDLAIESGWQPISQFFDEPLHHHCMTVARKNNL